MRTKDGQNVTRSWSVELWFVPYIGGFALIDESCADALDGDFGLLLGAVVRVLCLVREHIAALGQKWGTYKSP